MDGEGRRGKTRLRVRNRGRSTQMKVKDHGNKRQ